MDLGKLAQLADKVLEIAVPTMSALSYTPSVPPLPAESAEVKQL